MTECSKPLDLVRKRIFFFAASAAHVGASRTVAARIEAERRFNMMGEIGDGGGLGRSFCGGTRTRIQPTRQEKRTLRREHQRQGRPRYSALKLITSEAVARRRLGP